MMSTFTGGWTCGMCGVFMPAGIEHYCAGPRGGPWETQPTQPVWIFTDRSAEILEELRLIRKLLEKVQP